MLGARSPCRTACFIIGTLLVITLLTFGLFEPLGYSLPKPFGLTSDSTSKASPASSGAGTFWTFDAQRDAHNYGLTSDQCERAFPGLYDEIDHLVERRRHKRITREELTRDKWPEGTVRVLVWEQQIYVLEAINPALRRSRVYTTLHSLNQALMASTDREMLPNVEFVFSIEDWSIDDKLPIWAYDRKVADKNTWLMPDFGFYAWPEPGIGTYSEVRRRMREVEVDYPSFADKIQKLVWRGAVTASVAPTLRKHLVDVAANQTWADVQVLDWSQDDDSKRHRIDIEDHCKYMFIQHTEGRAWSGRLKFVQNCLSVIVFHKPEWVQHYQHLLVSEGEHQNFIQVERDFSDLPAKMEHLVVDVDEAERIAQNSARIFRDLYLTPAAVSCYWRKLLIGWSQVSFQPEFYTGSGPDRKWRGVPFESYEIMRKLEWDPV